MEGARLRVQQIGYSAQTLTLTIDTWSGTAGTGPPLVVRLVRHVAVLPEISVNAKSCLDLREVGSSAEGGAILSGAFENAERILALEKKYPFVLQFQRVVTRLDSEYSLTGGQVDTLEKDSRDYVPYRTGKVLERVFGREHLAAVHDLRLRGGGVSAVPLLLVCRARQRAGVLGLPNRFCPEARDHESGLGRIDAGGLGLDGLLRTETHLVNLPRRPERIS